VRLLPAGEAALLLELEPAEVLPLAEAVRAQRHRGITDIVPAERTVLVRFDPRVVGSVEIGEWLDSVRPLASGSAAEPALELPVHYDGADLAEVARLTGLTPAGVIAAHTDQEWLVVFCGFVPGFGYLRPAKEAAGEGQAGGKSTGAAGGESENEAGGDLLRVPRRAEPRVRVPAGAVALAAGYTGVYPRASPGGWHLIGRTTVPVWDAERDPPALLRPGTRVRFRDESCLR